MTGADTGMQAPFWNRVSKKTLAIAGGIAAGVVALAVLTGFTVDQVTRSTVPDLHGQVLGHAIEAAEGAGFEAKFDSRSRFCRYGDLRRELCVVDGQTPAAGERVHAGDVTVELRVVPVEVEIPDLVGMTYKDAVAEAAKVGAVVNVSDVKSIPTMEQWKVARQFSAGKEKAGFAVRVWLERPLVDAPDVDGMPLADALTAVEKAGLVATLSRPMPARRDPAWTVISTDMEDVDGRIPMGTTVNLTWGIAVPDVAGMSKADAQKAIQSAGLRATMRGLSDLNVTGTEPAAGTVVELESEVNVNLEPETVVYEVVGNGCCATVTWAPPGSFSIAQETNATLPWSKRWETTSDPHNFNAQLRGGDSITCNIYVNDKLVKTNTSTGPYAVVSCG